MADTRQHLHNQAARAGLAQLVEQTSRLAQKRFHGGEGVRDGHFFRRSLRQTILTMRDRGRRGGGRVGGFFARWSVGGITGGMFFHFIILVVVKRVR